MRQNLTQAEPKDLSATEALVEVRDLRTYFFLTEGRVRAVDGVSFSIARGRTLGVVGESGCGKSVTARSIMNMIKSPGRIVSGQVLYHRRHNRRNGSGHSSEQAIDLLKLPPMGEAMRSIRGGEFAMIFQEPKASFSPLHTVGMQIIEAITLHQEVSKEEARERAIEMLRHVNIPKPEERVDAYPHQLSGGMCQRAMIALALSCQPALLIADEPTTALDVTTEAQILDLMRDLQDSYQTAIMYITHNLAVLAEIANEAVVMYMGKDVEFGPIESIFYNPMHPYTRSLLRSIPRLDQEIDMLEVIRGHVPDPYALPKGCPFHPRCEFRQKQCSVDADVPHVQIGPDHYVRCHLYA